MSPSGSPDAFSRPNESFLAIVEDGTGSSAVSGDNPELRILADLVTGVRTGLPVQGILRPLLAAMAEALDASSAVLVLTAGHARDLLQPVVRFGRFEHLGTGCLDGVESFVGLGVRAERMVRSGDLSRDERAAEEERALGAGPACARALRVGSGAAGGVAFARDRGGAPFSDDDLATLTRFDQVAAVLLERLGLLRPGEDDPLGPAERRLMNTLRHQVNNPLAVIMGQTQILRHDPRVDADPHLRESIEAIHEGSARIRDVVRALTSPGEEGRRARDSDRLDPPSGGA